MFSFGLAPVNEGTDAAPGGKTYGEVLQPCFLGSAGGSVCDPSLPGSCIDGAAGGGVIVLGDKECRMDQLVLNHSALMASRGADKDEDFRIDAVDPQQSFGAGGGSGGSI